MVPVRSAACIQDRSICRWAIGRLRAALRGCQRDRSGGGTVLGGFLVLDQRGHGGGSGMPYYHSSHSEVKKRGYIQ